MIFNRHKRMIRRMGFISDQKGILFRYYNEKQQWQSHIDHCREFIIQNAGNKKKGSVAVLGSGWLLDVPAEYLTETFKDVYFFDICHPAAVRNRFKKTPHVHFIELDITGGAIQSCYDAYRSFRKKNQKIAVEDLKILGFRSDISFDYVISLNILNQLDILVLDYLLPSKIYTNDELNRLREIIQRTHIESLPAGKSILITDHEEIWTNAAGQAIGSKNLIYTVLDPSKISSRWQWFFDSHFNYYRNKNVVFNVTAMVL